MTAALADTTCRRSDTGAREPIPGALNHTFRRPCLPSPYAMDSMSQICTLKHVVSHQLANCLLQYACADMHDWTGSCETKSTAEVQIMRHGAVEAESDQLWLLDGKG